jgi:hypothetical protein
LRLPPGVQDIEIEFTALLDDAHVAIREIAILR